MSYSIFVIVLPPLIFIAFIVIIYRKLQLSYSRVKELELLNAAKDRLLTSIGHDLNQDINNLRPVIELYRSDSTSPEERMFLLNSIEERIYLAGHTLQSLLEWGKLQLKGLTLNPSYFNAAEIIQAKLNLMKVVIQNKGLTILNKTSAETSIYADVNQFRFIMRNLLSNAVKFSRISGTIEIDAKRFDSPDFTIFSVKDSGMGIAREKLKQIFQPFNVSTEGTSQEKGNGIGLLLCKEYAIENGGDIWVESEDNVGATFYMALRSFNHDKQFTNDTIAKHLPNHDTKTIFRKKL